ncbi:cold shock domain-containing protein [Micromonospora sp. BRA006-A]|nr:cold shock domain-containing protein [Micromonospora sp. BRA006-A]
MLTGKVVRFDEVRGYGFIAPDDGSDDVFVHANMLDGDKWALTPGVPVEYDAVETERGPKAVLVRVSGVAPGADRVPTAGAGLSARAGITVGGGRSRDSGQATGGAEDDEGLCDVLSERAFSAETTEALTSVPDLTGAQIVAVCEDAGAGPAARLGGGLTVAGRVTAAAVRPAQPPAISRDFLIRPKALRGSSSTKCTRRGAWPAERYRPTWSMSTCAVTPRRRRRR